MFYCSAYGNTQMIAGAVREGILSVLPGAEVPIYNIIEHDMAALSKELNESDAFLIGSPTINRDAVPPVFHLLASIDAVNIQKRPAALFGSYGWSGEALSRISQHLASAGVSVFEKKFKVAFVPTDADLRAAVEFGAEFAGSIV